MFTSSNPILSNNKFSPSTVNKRATNSAVAKVCQDLENKIQLSAHSRWLTQPESLYFTDLQWYYTYLEYVFTDYIEMYILLSTKKICKYKYITSWNINLKSTTHPCQIWQWHWWMCINICGLLTHVNSQSDLLCCWLCIGIVEDNLDLTQIHQTPFKIVIIQDDWQS